MLDESNNINLVVNYTSSPFNITSLPHYEGKEALQKLKEMGLEIDNENEALEHIGIFTFRVIAYEYGDFFKVDGQDKFIYKTNLKEILRVIHLNYAFRITLLYYLNMFEEWLGLEIINIIEKRYGINGLDNKDNFTNHEELNTVLKNIAYNKFGLHNYSLHQKIEHYPLEEIRNLSFGKKITLLKCLKKRVRIRILKNTKSNLSEQSFHLFSLYNKLRNHCSHINPLFDYKGEFNYNKPTNVNYFNPEYSLLFNTIISLKMFLPNKEMKNLVNDLYRIFIYAEDRYLQSFGLPSNWEEILRDELTK